MADHHGTNVYLDMDEQECCQHIRAIDKLVNDLDAPAEVVNQSYREVLADMRKDIKQRAFLPVLVSLCVKERLMQR